MARLVPLPDRGPRRTEPRQRWRPGVGGPSRFNRVTSVGRSLLRLADRDEGRPAACGTCPARDLHTNAAWVEPAMTAADLTTWAQVTVKALQQHRGAQNRERLLSGALWADHDLVFTKEDGTRLVRTAGLPPITVHGLRHTAASIVLAAGVPVIVVQQQLGHSSITVTADTYSYVSPALSMSAAGRVSDLLEAEQTGNREEVARSITSVADSGPSPARESPGQ